VPANNGLSRREPPDSTQLLQRILETPNLAEVVPRLPPPLLHRVIEKCGLEDCSALVTLATPEQLTGILDLDLWRSEQPGRDDHFDAGRFGVWLEVLAESGAGVAAEKLAAMDSDLVIAGLAQHVRVYDRGAVTPYMTTDGELVSTGRSLDDKLGCDIAGYRLVARRSESWDAIVAVLTALDEDHRDRFDDIMRGCRKLSNARFELDGLHRLMGDADQVMFDVAFDRERRREQQGFVTPPQARAFLEMSRQVRFDRDTMPSANPVARAYFHGLDDAAQEEGDSARSATRADSEPVPVVESANAAAAVVDLLREAGIMREAPRALLGGAREDAPRRLARIEAHLGYVGDRNPAVYLGRNEELAYLANAIVSGCTLQARPFTAQEASDAVVAVCNLGLENWPARWLASAQKRPPDASHVAAEALPEDFLIDHDLIAVFQVGWTVLHRDVCMYAAAGLLVVLSGLRSDEDETQAGLHSLFVALTKHSRSGMPWGARDDLDIIATLDMPAWAALLGLIDECPVMHAAIRALRDPRVRTIPASGFEFISENSQIELVRAFMQSLPDTLTAFL